MIQRFCLPVCVIVVCAMLLGSAWRGKSLSVVCYAAAICLLSQSRKWN